MLLKCLLCIVFQLFWPFVWLYVVKESRVSRIVLSIWTKHLYFYFYQILTTLDKLKIMSVVAHANWQRLKLFIKHYTTFKRIGKIKQKKCLDIKQSHNSLSYARCYTSFIKNKTPTTQNQYYYNCYYHCQKVFKKPPGSLLYLLIFVF